MKSRLVLLALGLFGQIALAGTGQGTITQIESGPIYGSKVFLLVTGGVPDRAGCTSVGNYNFVFDTSIPGGKELLAQMLLAKAMQQSVVISGAGTCTLYGGVEDMRWLRVL